MHSSTGRALYRASQRKTTTLNYIKLHKGETRTTSTYRLPMMTSLWQLKSNPQYIMFCDIALQSDSIVYKCAANGLEYNNRHCWSIKLHYNFITAHSWACSFRFKRSDRQLSFPSLTFAIVSWTDVRQHFCAETMHWLVDGMVIRSEGNTSR